MSGLDQLYCLWNSFISDTFYWNWLHPFQNLTNLDWSRFVRRDRSSPVKKNAHIFLVVVGVVILFSSAPNLRRAPQTMPSYTTNRLHLRPAAQMDVAKSDFSQTRRSRSDLSEGFARINLDLSDFEKECNHCLSNADVMFMVYVWNVEPSSSLHLYGLWKTN